MDIVFHDNGYSVKIFNESIHLSGNHYSKVFGNDNQRNETTKYRIEAYQNEILIDKCLLIGHEGATSINENTILKINSDLIICCSNYVFCIATPELNVRWKTKADLITCFQIFNYQTDYIIHGENQITRLDKNGKIKWEFSGEDIFVSTDDNKEIEFTNESILLKDFNESKYQIDFNGNLITDTIRNN
ncbi:MAG: hypothetical protein ACPG4Z_05100 [Chitinophagales bacterium]